MLNLPIHPSIIILAITTFIASFLYLREHAKRSKLESEGERFLKEVQEKGWETLHQSVEKSQDILGQAELEGLKVLAQSRVETSRLEKHYAEKIIQLINESQQTIAASQEKLLQFMADLQKRSQEFQDASQRSGEQRINQLFEGIETRLSDFLVQTAQKTTSSIELELKASRQLIEGYKEQQLKLIDENIIAMMEQTLNIVLGKKLTLKDQLELIYEALEKAKIDKFVV